jgi:hypothetical protein
MGWSIVATGDFDGDGKTDLVWRQASSGTNVLWLMNGATQSSSAALGGDTDWRITTTGDYNGDGKTDLVWRQNSSGASVLWLMNGASSTYLGGNSDWTVVAYK